MVTGASPRDFVLVEGRPLRRPLPAWAGELVERLDALAAEERPDPAAVSTCLNLGALIEAYRGRLDHADRLCDLHLDWLARLARLESVHDDRAGVLALAFQPWINKGRLHVLAGKPADALPHFSVIADGAAGDPIVLGSCTIDRDLWSTIVQRDPSVAIVLRNVHAVESLKAYLRGRDGGGALAFVAALRTAGWGGDDDVLMEAQLIGLAGLARFDDAVALAGSYRGPSLLTHLVVAIHRSAALVALGRRREARGLALELASFVELGGVDAFPPVTALRLLAMVGRVLEAAGCTGPARDVHEEGLDRARREADEPSQAEFLDALARAGQDRGPERRRLLAGCHYAAVWRAAGVTPPPDHPVFDELLAGMARATGSFRRVDCRRPPVP